MKYVLAVIGAALTLGGIWGCFVSNYNLGVLLTLIMGILILCYGIFYKNIQKKTAKGPLKYLKYGVGLFLGLMLGIMIFICVYGSIDTSNHQEEAIIVLGAGIHGETVSLSLRYRLDECISSAEKNPDAMIVVSGGRGFQEDITEALAMERYLVLNGISPERIIKEERATSTKENFKFSKEVLDMHFQGNYNIAFITNDFHIYRAAKIAKINGLSATHIGAKTAYPTMIQNYLRESLAVLKLWIVDMPQSGGETEH